MKIYLKVVCGRKGRKEEREGGRRQEGREEGNKGGREVILCHRVHAFVFSA